MSSWERDFAIDFTEDVGRRLNARLQAQQIAKQAKPLGVLTLIFLLAIMTWIGLANNAFGVILPDLVAFLTGNIRQIIPDQTPMLQMLGIIIATVAINIPLAILALVIVQKVAGKEKGTNLVSTHLEFDGSRRLFGQFLQAVVLEEIFARWFFLGLLYRLPMFATTGGFYALFILGNGIWALIHLYNFKNHNDRHWIRVLPQFVGGIFLTYIFVKFGFIAAVMAHFMYNMTLFSIRKNQRFNQIDMLIIAVAGIGALVTFGLMDKPLSDILVWFSDNPTFSLEGWNFWDYVKLDVFITFASSGLFTLLLFDSDRNKESPQKTLDKYGLGGLILAMFVASIIIVAIQYGIFWLMGKFITEVPYRILIVTLLFMFMFSTAPSPSAVSRQFWSGIPGAYIMMCTLLTFTSFWTAVGFIFVCGLTQIPLAYIKAMDD